MSFKEYTEYKKQAFNRQGDYKFNEAGDYYTLASHTILGKSGYTTEPFEKSSADIARGLRCLLSAALSYRLGQVEKRAQNRCEQGILLAEDIRDYEVRHTPQRGLMY